MKQKITSTTDCEMFFQAFGLFGCEFFHFANQLVKQL